MQLTHIFLGLDALINHYFSLLITAWDLSAMEHPNTAIQASGTLCFLCVCVLCNAGLMTLHILFARFDLLYIEEPILYFPTQTKYVSFVFQRS